MYCKCKEYDLFNDINIMLFIYIIEIVNNQCKLYKGTYNITDS